MKAIVVHELGGPEVLSYEDTDDPIPRPDEALVRIEAAGVNFLDIYYRAGFHWGGHHKRELPYTPGAEGAGRVIAVGSMVAEASVGDRVAFGVSNGHGAYAELISIKSKHLVKMPDSLDMAVAAAVMQQGMTAHYLSQSLYALKLGDSALVHAAAGGTGLLLCQMIKICGARVIGVVSSAQKAEAARDAGADDVIISSECEFDRAVRDMTKGKGVSVAYDSVGKSTFERSLDSLAPRGMMVLYGQSSGPVPAFDTAVLNAKGSLLLARPSLTHYIAERADLERRASDIFSWIREGRLKVRIDRTFALQDARRAHERMASRQSIGKLVLTPEAG